MHLIMMCKFMMNRHYNDFLLFFFFFVFCFVLSLLLDRGICGNMVGNRNCSKDSFCIVSRGRFLDSCTCNDGYLGNGFVCEGN